MSEFDKEAQSPVTDDQISADIASKMIEVESLLAKKLKPQALLAALRNPPTGNKSEFIKDSNASIIEKVLLSLQDAEINATLEILDSDSCDLLFKYVYRFMGRAQNCALMLKLHSKLCEKAGMGSIIRVLTDRKQV